MILAKVCASRHLTVVVTVQLATKMIGVDGTTANFDTAKKAIMVPQLGEKPFPTQPVRLIPCTGDSYLPSSRAHRFIFIPDSPTTGYVLDPSRSGSLTIHLAKGGSTAILALSFRGTTAGRISARTLRNGQLGQRNFSHIDDCIES